MASSTREPSTRLSSDPARGVLFAIALLRCSVWKARASLAKCSLYARALTALSALLRPRAGTRWPLPRAGRAPAQLAQPDARARHGGHGRRLAHSLPDRHLLPRGLGPRRVRRRHRPHATRARSTRALGRAFVACRSPALCARLRVAVPPTGLRARLPLARSAPRSRRPSRLTPPLPARTPSLPTAYRTPTTAPATPPGHARVRACALLGQDAAGSHAARPRARDPVRRHQAGAGERRATVARPSARRLLSCSSEGCRAALLGWSAARCLPRQLALAPRPPSLRLASNLASA